MKVLGISCGRRMSNTEILVKEALMGAEEAGAEVEFIRLQDLNIKPCTGCNSCVEDLMERGGGGRCSIKNDDFPFIDNKVMDSDGLILGSPIYEKSPTGLLKTLEDRMGPSHDQGFRIIAQKIREEKGITMGTGPDPRAFKPRAGSLIAVGGSEWDTLALPVMSLFALTLQIEVVDKILVNWIGLPRVVALRDDLLERAHRSGARGGKPQEAARRGRVHRRTGNVPALSLEVDRSAARARRIPVHLRHLRRPRHAERHRRQGLVQRER